MLYKGDDEREWHEGVTVNLSASGALIDGEPPATHAGTIVVVIPLLSSDGCFTGRGRFVRTSGDRAEEGRFAVVIPRLRLQRQTVALANLDSLHHWC